MAVARCDIDSLRALMRESRISALVVPSEDPHQSEYSCGAFSRREAVSAFTGSAGVAAVTLKHGSALSTDGRYFLQAEMQLDAAEWELLRFGEKGVPTIGEWLAQKLECGESVGIDPAVHSVDNAVKLRKELAAGGVELRLLDGENLVDAVLGDAREPLPTAAMRVHALEHAGLSVCEKLELVRGEMREEGAGVLLLSTLDEVAWIFNTRGQDVPHCPVTLSYALIGLDFARLFVDERKVTAEVRAHLSDASVEVHPYGACAAQLQALVAEGKRAWLDAATGSAGMQAAAETGASTWSDGCGGDEPAAKKRRAGSGAAGSDPGVAMVTKRSPVIKLKSRKNPAELKGMRECHLRDATALCRFFAWLGERIAAGDEGLDEGSASDKLLEERQSLAGFLDTSFDTIAGDGPNGAIIHYRAEKATCRKLKAGDVFLLDSGAQYEDGTTDITRTTFLGEGMPDAHVRRCFTLVLKGHIALDTAVFPEGTPGFAVDSFARHALWRAGLDYRHGTGHGVGAALNVHEGPQSISPRWYNKSPLEDGMIVSNEPGYYEQDAFGIRIENLVSIEEADTPCTFGDKKFLCFKKLTFVPLQTKMIDVSLLTADEADWVDAYQAQVRAKVRHATRGGRRTAHPLVTRARADSRPCALPYELQIQPLLTRPTDADAQRYLVEHTQPLDRKGLGTRSATGGQPQLASAEPMATS